MAEDGVGVGRVAEVLVTLAFYEVVGVGVYLGVFHTAALVSTLEPGSITGTVAAAPGVVLVGPDARLVAGGLALFAGMSAFDQEDTPGVGDFYGSDAPSGLTYPFYVLRVGRGTLLGTAVGAAFGAGLYLVVVHTDALGRGRGPEAGGRPRSVLGVVAANPDAAVGALAGGGQ